MNWICQIFFIALHTLYYVVDEDSVAGNTSIKYTKRLRKDSEKHNKKHVEYLCKWKSVS